MPATPQITITGTLDDILGVAIAHSSIVIQLCGFGSQVPRVAGTAMIADVAPIGIDCPAGTIPANTKLWGNDVITPANTYYTIQFLDDNGNVVQVNAYQFSGTAAVDISTVVPYSPFVPPAIPALPIGSMDAIIPFAANAIYNAMGTFGAMLFEMVLTGDLTTPTLINVTPGQIITFMFIQDGAGGHAVVWMPNVFGGAMPDPTPGSVNTQSFIVRSTGNLYPLGPMTTI